MTDTASPETCDVIVVGGGPSGLAAATRLRALGAARVIVLEREAEAGGVPRHCGHSPYGLREYRRLMSGQRYARALVRDALAAGVDMRTSHSVVDCAPGPNPVVTVSAPDGLHRIAASKVVLATGIRETPRSARLIGGDRPHGIMTTGALQSMVYLNGLTPFRRPVILGTELVSFSALLTCRHAGAKPAAMIEPNARTTAWRVARGLPMALGIPLHLNTDVVAIHGDAQVESVTVESTDGGTLSIVCDGVVTSGKFVPETALVRRAGWTVDAGTAGPAVDQYGRTDDASYFATGNLLRPVETAGWCWQEGRTVADAVWRDLAHGLPAPTTAVPVCIASDALRYAMAQRLCPGDTHSVRSGRIQLRATRPARGRLTVSTQDRDIWSKAVSVLPERRLFIPLAAILPALTEHGPVIIRLQEDA